MKKIIIAFLNIVLSFCFLTPTWIMAKAAETKGSFSLKFSLVSDEGHSVVAAKEGDVITVSFKMQRTDSNDAYTTNGFQNYIHYDLSFFELIEDSIVCNDTGSATAKKQNSITYGEIIQCQNLGKTYESDFVFCSFQLKVIGESGSGTVYNEEVYAFDADFQEIPIAVQNLKVEISDCVHANKIKVGAKNPTCDEDGYEAYCYCNDCGLFFDENGENLLASVPFIEGGHSFSDDVVYDEDGHWYECTVCGEKSDISVHSGGTATCKSKAKCDTCGQEYGDIDAHNHKGETYTKNEKVPLPWESGYSGDVYCSECQELIKSGESISNWNITAWPWWIIVVGLVALLLMAIVICLFSKA